jgi:hypothetical protein
MRGYLRANKKSFQKSGPNIFENFSPSRLTLRHFFNCRTDGGSRGLSLLPVLCFTKDRSSSGKYGGL